MMHGQKNVKINELDCTLIFRGISDFISLFISRFLAKRHLGFPGQYVQNEEHEHETTHRLVAASSIS